MVEDPRKTSRPWNLRSEEYRASPERLSLAVEQLQIETGLSELTLRALLLRGYSDPKQIENYLEPKLETLTHPFEIQDLRQGAERIAQAKERDEEVLVFGDYDVDGTCGAALLSWVFRDLGVKHRVRQPDRFSEGYGLGPYAVEEAQKLGISLIVSVDCGITSFEAADRAAECGIDLVVVDHHQLDPQRGLPLAKAVINPQRPDCSSGRRELCGCGLAFYLALGLRSIWREREWFGKDLPEPNLKRHLDLVVLATACDMVPLVADNRVLTRHGIDVLRHTTKPGLRALMQLSGLVHREKISPGALGFTLGPRINASGRMESASIALEVLTTHDPARGAQLATDLEKLNQERMAIQNAIWDEVRERVESGIAQGKFKNAIVVADASWHEGVVGIVASRVTETFRRPAIVIAVREGMGKGSVRSYGNRNVLGGLHRSAEYLSGYGGHKMAAGLSLKPDQIEAFAERFDLAMSEIPAEIRDALLIDGECRLEDLSLKTIQEIENMGPFGPGNPEPVFVLQAPVYRRQILKGRHLKFVLGSPKSGCLEAMWFSAAEKQENLESTDPMGEARSHDWAGVPELNRFRGNRTPTFRVKEFRADHSSGPI